MHDDTLCTGLMLIREHAHERAMSAVDLILELRKTLPKFHRDGLPADQGELTTPFLVLTMLTRLTQYGLDTICLIWNASRATVAILTRVSDTGLLEIYNGSF